MGMTCARKGCSVDARALAILRSSRTRVRQKRSRLLRSVCRDAIPFDFSAILKRSSPSHRLYRKLRKAAVVAEQRRARIPSKARDLDPPWHLVPSVPQPRSVVYRLAVTFPVAFGFPTEKRNGILTIVLPPRPPEPP